MRKMTLLIALALLQIPALGWTKSKKTETPAETPVPFTLDPGSTPTHQFGTWTLSTAGLDPCGYVVRLDAADRTIANCGSGPWRDHATVGFCLRAP